MPILDQQMRLRELGRIRIGEVKPTANGKTRPSKLESFRFTTANRPIIDRLAELYGGTVEAWTRPTGGASEWEVITEATEIPVVIFPDLGDPLSQWFESWSGGGCQRRCDGVTETLSEQPCLCEPDNRVCKPTTRLSVMLRDLDVIGMFRLESHGYNAMAELPAGAALCVQMARIVGHPIAATLDLREQSDVKDGQTRRWMVPGLNPQISPASLIEVTGPASKPAIEAGGQTAIGQAVAAPTEDEWRRMIAAAPSVDVVRALWNKAKESGGPAWVEDACKQRATELTAAGRPDVAATEDDPEALWQQIVAASPFDTLTELDADFAARSGGLTSATASAGELAAYLRVVRGAA